MRTRMESEPRIMSIHERRAAVLHTHLGALDLLKASHDKPFAQLEQYQKDAFIAATLGFVNDLKQWTILSGNDFERETPNDPRKERSKL